MSARFLTPADMRAARFEVLVAELRPLLRQANPEASDEAVLERAVHIAAFRLAGGDLPWALVG